MSIGHPSLGRVLSYFYLWPSEHDRGHENATKPRPCPIVHVRPVGRRQEVRVLPISHRAPGHGEAAVQLPDPVRRHLGLPDDGPSWVYVDQWNRFIWPGCDINRVGNGIAPRFDHGFLPPKFFRHVVQRLGEHFDRGRVKDVWRTE